MRRAFSLVELLAVIAVIAVLVALITPALFAAREAGRASVCLANLKQSFVLCRAYADENRGYGPGLGRPYTALPHWALIIQQFSGRTGVDPVDLYSARSILICQTANARYGGAMTRTYAVNATGHAGLPGDPDNFDAPPVGRSTHVRFDQVQRPSQAVLLVDSAVVSFNADGPPPTQCSSVIDFRQEGHRPRLARFHSVPALSSAGAFNGVAFDGSATARRTIPDDWLEPLP